MNNTCQNKIVQIEKGKLYFYHQKMNDIRNHSAEHKTPQKVDLRVISFKPWLFKSLQNFAPIRTIKTKPIKKQPNSTLTYLTNVLFRQ